jgi:para-nitrobenzyl esterase
MARLSSAGYVQRGLPAERRPDALRSEQTLTDEFAIMASFARSTLVPTILFALLGLYRPAPAPRVTIDTGVLAGAVDSSTGVLVFRGIPYAAPPVGALRWRPPRSPQRWPGVRAADRLGHNCMQGQPYSDIDPYVAGISEDCLYLNVWTTSLGERARRPVMVWIHGGGFFAGFGGEERHNGATLAKKGAVVVTLNYRLGPFGFFAHPALAAESPQHA